MSKPAKTAFQKNDKEKEYGLCRPVSPRDSNVKFQRKQDNKPRIDAIGRERIKKGQEYTQNCQLFYISSPQKIQNRFSRCNSLTQLNSKHKSPHTRWFPNSQTQKIISINENGNTSGEDNFSPSIKLRANSITEIKNSPAVEIEQLKLNKLTLLNEIKQLRLNLDAKDKAINRLERQLEQTETKIDSLQRRILKLESEAENFKSVNQKQRQTIQTYEAVLREKEDSKNSIETRSDLQKILSDINRNFDDICLQSKLQEESGLDLQQPRFEQVIMSLQEKIKYQEIQIGMLKKQRYTTQKQQMQAEKLRMQNRLLSRKLKNVNEKSKQQQQRKNLAFDYSISFELSRDQELRMQ